MDPDFHVSSARFSYCFRNFRQIKKLTYSPACWIQNLPWKIFIEPVVQGGKKYLSVYVGCTQSGIEHWTCSAVVEIYKLFGSTPKIIRANTSLIFDSAASTSWGHVQFMQWDVVSNPVNGFIAEGAVTIEVTLTAEIPVGLTLTPDHFTDERAQIFYSQWISEKNILEEKIQNLKSINEEKENEIISHQKSIENLENQLEESKVVSNQLNEYKKNLETEHSTLEQLRLKNEVCEDDLKKEKENSENLKQKISDANTEINNLQEKIVSLSKKLDDYKKIIQNSNTNNICDQTLQLTESENVNLKKKLASLEADLKDSSNKLKKQTEDHANEINSIEIEKDTLKNNLETISKDFSSAKEELNSMKTTNFEEKATMKKKEEEFNKAIQELKDQIKNLNVTNQNLNTDKSKLEEQVSTLQLKLQKTSETEEIVREKQKSLEIERDGLKNSLETISKDCNSAKEELNSLKITNSETQVELRKNEEELSKAIQDLKDQIKNLNVSNQDLNTKKDKLEEQVATLQLQLKKNDETEEIVREKLKTIEKERDDLKKSLETVSKDYNLAKEELNSLKKSNSEIQVAMKKNEDELNKEILNFKTQINNLNETNHELNSAIDGLENQVAAFQVQLQKNNETEENVQVKQSIIDNLKTENQNLIAQMKVGYEQYNKLKTLKDNVDSQLKIMMQNHSQVNEEAAQLQKTIASTQNDLSVCKQNLEQLRNENEKLNAKVPSSTTQLDIKNKLTPSKDDSNDMTDLKDYCDKLKSELTSLINSLTDSRNEIQRMKNKFKKRTTDGETPNFQIDLNNKNVTRQENNLKNSTPGNSIEETVGKYKIAIEAKNKLKDEMDALRKNFEKINKDTYDEFKERNENVTKEINDLQFKLEEERIEKLRILDRKKDVDDELTELKQENQVHIKRKNALLCQLRECHHLLKEVFWIIIELVKIKKSQDTMPFSIEAHLKDIMALLSVNKKRTISRSTIREADLNEPTNVVISTEVIQKKLEDLEVRLEKEIEMISSELEAEKTKKIKLILSNEKLTHLLENEMIMRDQYKKLVRSNELRSQEIQCRMIGSYNQISEEKNRRFHYEDDLNSLSKKIAKIEVQTDVLKKSFLRDAVELYECSCSSSENLSFRNLRRNIQISPDSVDVRTGIAGCESQTSIDEHPVYTPSTGYNSKQNNVAVKQDTKKNAKVDANIEGARIIESDPISASKTN